MSGSRVGRVPTPLDVGVGWPHPELGRRLGPTLSPEAGDAARKGSENALVRGSRLSALVLRAHEDSVAVAFAVDPDIPVVRQQRPVQPVEATHPTERVVTAVDRHGFNRGDALAGAYSLLPDRPSAGFDPR